MNYKIIFLLFLLPVFSCTRDVVELDLNGNKLIVEIASSDQERQLGLMNRDSMDMDRGMIFVFDEERSVSFWMKNTRIPLSIAYIGKNGTIYEIYDLHPYSLEPVPSKRSSILYALEVNRGYFEDNKMEVGDRIDLTPVLNYLKSSM